MTPKRGPGKGDWIAIGVLTALAFAYFGVPSLFGQPVMPGDDLTQNYPLRVLVGQQLRAGHLPLYNPYIWSGAALLAGWNAAAAYPLTWLFAVMPAVGAWTAGLVVTYVVASVGMFGFLRAGLRLGTLGSFLGGLTFAFAGAMAAQRTHFGLVSGMSWVPLGLLAVVRATAPDVRLSGRLRWGGVLGLCVGLMILAGEPRAIADGGIIIALYGIWRVLGSAIRRGRQWRASGGLAGAIAVMAGLVLGVALGAVQVLPGVAAIDTSQRAAASLQLFSSGSLPNRWLVLMLIPDMLGGTGTLGQPSFFGSYNLTEISGYVGIVPVVAAFAMLPRLPWAEVFRRPDPSGRFRPSLPSRLSRFPEWLVWYVMAVLGVLLALGGNTPLGTVLARLPFYGTQRLQSRNVLLLDLALAVLLAYWADKPFPSRTSPTTCTACAAGGLPASEPDPGSRPARSWWPGRRVPLDGALGALPAVAVLALVAATIAGSTGLYGWLDYQGGVTAAEIAALWPWLLPFAVLAAGALALVTIGRRLPRRAWAQLVCCLVVVDMLVFSALAVGEFAPRPAPSAPSAPSGAAPSVSFPSAPLRAISQLGYPGRFAIYDPDQIANNDLVGLGMTDLNSSTGTPSVQGYTSIVDGQYATATGSHQATGEGQNALSPAAIGNGTLDSLDTTILLTVPQYLVTTPAGHGSATGTRNVSAGQRGTWYLGTTLRVTQVVVPDAAAARDATAGLAIGLEAAGGSITWLHSSASGTSLTARLPSAVTAAAVVVAAGSAAARLGAPSITVAGGGTVTANGVLQDALVPPRWTLDGFDGAFAIFADRLAVGPLTLAALPGTSPASLAGASVRDVTGLPTSPASATVTSASGVRVVRSVAAIPGWSATWQPTGGGGTVTLPVQADGVVQAVDVPAGRGVLSWHYTAPRFVAGLALSLGATLALLLLLLAPLLSRLTPPSPRDSVAALPGARWRKRRSPDDSLQQLQPHESR
ncbi:MAG TPA: hypothetical protein VHZ03_08620 [Trebonia sp.]|jgi:hypothetical protein|nr:hypothetical protein [Trebonia sp.]